ncbi:MAG: LysR family transcriptional regulator [Pseudomonadota bacterium]
MDRRLKQFLAVAEMGNVSLAADAMNVSQPTVSVNMRRLEEEYGVSLFQRSSRGVALTDYGQILLEHVRVMARLNANATIEIQARKQIDRPSVKIGTGSAWWSLFMREFIDKLRAENPELIVHVEVCSSFDGLRHLLSGDVQCFVGTKVATISEGLSFDFETLFEVEDAYFVRDGHPLAGTRTNRSTLSAYPRLDVAPLVNRHVGVVDARMDNREPDWAHPLRAPLSTNSVTAGLDLLHDSNAYLVYPMAAAKEFKRHGIVKLDVEDRPRQAIPIGMYTVPEKTDNASITPLLERLRHEDWSRLQTS